MKNVWFDSGFTFKYSPRDNTEAYKLEDDVPENIKIARLEEINSLLREIALKNNKEWIGRKVEIMIEGVSRRSDSKMFGKTDGFKKVIVNRDGLSIGSFVNVIITGATSQTLFGEVVE